MKTEHEISKEKQILISALIAIHRLNDNAHSSACMALRDQGILFAEMGVELKPIGGEPVNTIYSSDLPKQLGGLKFNLYVAVLRKALININAPMSKDMVCKRFNLKPSELDKLLTGDVIHMRFKKLLEISERMEIKLDFKDVVSW